MGVGGAEDAVAVQRQEVMPTPPSAESLHEAIQDIIKASPHGEERQAKLSELLALLRQTRSQASSQDEPDAESSSDQDCPEDVEDCRDVTSPCCDAQLSTVFGTLPLKVRCKSCGVEYFMGKLMRDLLKSEKRSAGV